MCATNPRAIVYLALPRAGNPAPVWAGGMAGVGEAAASALSPLPNVIVPALQTMSTRQRPVGPGVQTLLRVGRAV